jgi:hypothetical protein
MVAPPFDEEVATATPRARRWPVLAAPDCDERELASARHHWVNREWTSVPKPVSPGWAA